MRVCPTCFALSADFSHCPKDGAATLEHSQVLIGVRLGPYVVRSLLSEGGMGVVYAGEHPTLGRRVALKVLRPEFSLRDDIVERFTMEARAVNTIGHANIVNIYDFGTTPYGSFFIVMEYLDGRTVRHLIEERGAQTLKLAFFVFEGVARALAAAHEKGFIHRDIKPENIMLCTRSDGEEFIKLLDFGIAKLLGEQAAIQSQTGSAMGTPQYMCPEHLEDLSIDHRADIYALGVVTYEMLTGKTPYCGRSQAAVRQLQLTSPPSAPSQMQREIPISHELDAAILRAIALNPDDRFQTMADLIEAVDGGVQSSYAMPRPLAIKTAIRKRRVSILAATGLLLCSLCAIAVILLNPKSDPAAAKSQTLTALSLPTKPTKAPAAASNNKLAATRVDSRQATTYVQQMLVSNRPRQRTLAVSYLGELGRPVLIQQLVAALKDPRPDVRRAAARALGQSGDRGPGTLTALRAALDGNQKFVAVSVATALARLGDRGGVQYLRQEQRKTSSSPVYANFVLEALGEVGQADPRTLEREQRDGIGLEKRVRYLGYMALHPRGVKAKAKLMDMLESRDLHARLLAARALAPVPGTKAAAVGALRQLLKKNHQELKLEAARILCRLGDTTGADLLLRSLGSTSVGEEGATITSALALGSVSPSQRSPEVGEVLGAMFVQAHSADAKLAAAVALLGW
jgi:serine/threonine protein kinase